MALEPITRQEQIIAGEDLEPITRMERFLKKYSVSQYFGEETTTVTGDTLTWDGNTEGRECVIDSYYKVSDSVLNKTDLIGGYTVVFNGIDSVLVDSETVEAMFNGEGFYNDGMITIVPYDGYVSTEAEIVFPKKGLYFYSLDGGYISSLTIPGYTGFISEQTIIHKLPVKFLPDDATVFHLTSPNGTKYAITVDDSGVLSATEV